MYVCVCMCVLNFDNMICTKKKKDNIFFFKTIQYSLSPQREWSGWVEETLLIKAKAELSRGRHSNCYDLVGICQA